MTMPDTQLGRVIPDIHYSQNDSMTDNVLQGGLPGRLGHLRKLLEPPEEDPLELVKSTSSTPFPPETPETVARLTSFRKCPETRWENSSEEQWPVLT